jgi:hypothetical protein
MYLKAHRRTIAATVTLAGSRSELRLYHKYVVGCFRMPAPGLAPTMRP